MFWNVLAGMFLLKQKFLGVAGGRDEFCKGGSRTAPTVALPIQDSDLRSATLAFAGTEFAEKKKVGLTCRELPKILPILPAIDCAPAAGFPSG